MVEYTSRHKLNNKEERVNILNKKETPKQLASRLQREYHQQWRKNNPEKVKANTENFWLRKANELIESQKEEAGE